MGAPSFWTPDFPDLVARRESMPGVDRLQTTYVKYKRFSEAQVSQSGWDLGSSRRNYEQLVRTEHQHFLPDDHLLFTGLAPEAVSIKIVEAPAEFAVPVKQDRRLSPSFRVRVEVKYRQRVSFPLTLKAHVITQQEKDNVLAWHHEETPDQDRAQVGWKKPVTDLKGTTCITHHFEANGNPLANALSYGYAAAGQQPQQQLAGLDSREQRLLAAEVAANLYPNQTTRVNSMLVDFPQLQTHSVQSKTLSSNMLLNLWSTDSNDVKIMEQMLMQQQQKLPNQQSLYNNNALDASLLQPQQQQQQQYQYNQLASPPQSAFAGAAAQAEPASIVQDFEFANLEFLKPTRMNKVYMVFACTILDLDTLFVVYNVPTIGICRAEQREKACQKLGVCMPLLGNEFANMVKTDHGIPEVLASLRKRESLGARSAVNHIKREAPEQLQPQPAESSESEGNFQPIRTGDLPLQHRNSFTEDDVSMAQSLPRSRLAMREWILEEYENTGLTRKLTQLDMQALLSQAGFPVDSSSDHANISQHQWDEFSVQFRNVLSLLRQIATVWNLEDPCVISGFDMDRIGTVQALAKEPAGTFICRFSMSQPGCLVLSCKTVPGHPKADVDNLIHAIIKIDDLYERRVDTWIRDFAGATHVLDVYRQKRVDKRKVFASNYMRLKGLEAEVPYEFAVPAFPEAV